MATYIKQYTTPYIGIFVDDLDELGDIEKAVIAISDRTGAVYTFDGEIDESGLVSVHLTEEQSGAIADGLCSLEVSFLIDGDIVEKTETVKFIMLHSVLQQPIGGDENDDES